MPYILSPWWNNFRPLIVFLLLSAYTVVPAQEFGGFPLSMKWRQIKTDTCRIIFPSYLEPSAQRMANLFHYLKKNDRDNIGDKAFDIDLVLHNQTTIPNGFVGIAPWKTYFHTTPFQNSFELTALPWLDLLAIHEYRHVIQLSTARRGITNVLYHLFGEETWSGAANLAIPDWFLEGDAVWAETQLSRQGRGRIANFMKGYRALSQENIRYSYPKARNGSIKDFVPNHYRLGYLMMDYGHIKYEPTFWKEVFMEASAYKGIFYPFSRAIQTRTGLSTTSLYHHMLDENSKTWNTAVIDENSHVHWPLQTPKTFTDFQYPRPNADGSLSYFKRSYEKIGGFYHLSTNGIETKLLLKGQAIDSYYGKNKHFYTWTEYTTDPRWLERDYSNIWWYNHQTGEMRKITSKEKYFSPQSSADGNQIVAVHFDETTQCQLQILNAVTGQPIALIPNPDQWYFTYPQWDPSEEKIITAVRNELGEMTISAHNIDNGGREILLPFANRIIGAPFLQGNYIFYSASTGQSENVYVLHIPSRTEVQLTQESLGAFQPSFQNDTLYYLTFTSLGHQIRKKKIDLPRGQRQVTSASNYQIPYQKDILEDIPDKTYPVRPYAQGLQFMNIHTWGFDYDDPEVMFRILSNNVLNNFQLSAGASYNYDLDQISPFAEIRYGLLPIEIGFNASALKRSFVNNDQALNWWEIDLLTFLSTDLNLSSRTTLRNLIPVFGISNTLLRGEEFPINGFNSFLTSLTFTQKRLKARKNLFTKNGQYLHVSLSNSIDRLEAQQFRVRTGLALPGIGINHNLILHADYKTDRYAQDLENNQYQFGNALRPRGFSNVAANDIWRFTANYHLPLVYPDWGFLGLIYFYRIRANLYFEYAPYNYTSGDEEPVQMDDTLLSSGVEIVFDTKLTNTVNATFGIRWVNPINNERNLPYNRIEFFVPVYRF